MPWREIGVMDERREFVSLASHESANRRELCRRFGISATTGDKWLDRFASGDADLTDRSRRPHHSPERTGEALELAVLKIRDAHPAWGARKIFWCLERDGLFPPSASTIHAILQRHGRITEPGRGPKKYIRFEHPHPNAVWQMDFKGYFPMTGGGSCHPLTVVDDHSRYSVCLKACDNERAVTVKDCLCETFGRYGLPDAMLVDNGSPWGGGPGYRWTQLGVWLLKLGVDVIHSRPYHPQTRGKNERFHRSLKAEVLATRRFRDLEELQQAFDAWRTVYNLERPHQGIDMDVPADRYQPSSRSMLAELPEVEYDENEETRRVGTTKSYISFKGKLWKVPKAFMGQRVAIRPHKDQAAHGIYFGARKIATINLNDDGQAENV